MSGLGHERRPFKSRPLDNFRYATSSDRGRLAAQYVAKGQLLTHAPQQEGFNLITSSARASTVHSGNTAFRSSSISSFEFGCQPRAIHADIVKVGSTSSRRAAASRA